MGDQRREIAEFFNGDELFEAFREQMCGPEEGWQTCLDHAGRIVVLDMDFGLFTVQPSPGGGYDAVEFKSLIKMFDPTSTPVDNPVNKSKTTERIGHSDTPKGAFEALCRHRGLDLDMETPSP